MKLGSLRVGGRDGTLVVVARDLARATAVRGVAATLQQAIEDWESVAPELERVYRALNDGRCADTFYLDPTDLASPLPRFGLAASLFRFSRIQRAKVPLPAP